MRATAPRILLVLPDHPERAALRAELRERGYDAVGAPDLPAALLDARDRRGRGPVRLVVVDAAAARAGAGWMLDRILSGGGRPSALLLARAMRAPPRGPWRRILRRPVRVEDVVAAVEEIVPPAIDARPLDT